MLIGYARVSTDEQQLDLQIEALKHAGCGKLFQDRLPATARQRPGFDKALECLGEGDTLVVCKLERLGRPLRGLMELMESLWRRGVQFRSLADGIDTSQDQGRSFFSIMAAFAEMERGLLRERAHVALAAARARSRKGGRKPKMTPGKLDSARKLLCSGMAPKDVAFNLGVSVPTLYRWIPGGRAELSGAGVKR